jgi:hypothetical protein
MDIAKIITKAQLQDLFSRLYKTGKTWFFNPQTLLNSIQLQLFISFISLPFLIAWGLPISLLSPVSTLLFGPFLSCFLLISSLIFFLELLYLPNTFLIWLLEKVTAFWMTCLGLEQKAWLIGFTKPPMVIIFLIPVIALIIIHSKKITSIGTRIGYLAFFLVMTCIILKYFPYSYNTIEKIPCHKGEITLINHDNTLIMIDPGYLASRPSFESFIAYTLLPEIVQKTGKLTIDHVIIFKFNKRILDALQFLATKISIKNIYIPYWQGKIPRFAWQSYAKLKKTLVENNGKIHSISYKKQIYKDATVTLFIEPVATKTVSYYDATYQQLSAMGTIKNQKLII